MTADGADHENRWALKRLPLGHDVRAAMARALLYITKNMASTLDGPTQYDTAWSGGISYRF